MDSTSADRWSRKLKPSFVAENCCCNLEDSVSYSSLNSLPSGDCVGMPAFLVCDRESRQLEPEPWTD